MGLINREIILPINFKVVKLMFFNLLGLLIWLVMITYFHYTQKISLGEGIIAMLLVLILINIIDMSDSKKAKK